MNLRDRIRQAAREQGLGIDQFREKHGFGNSTFYRVLRGGLPGTQRFLRKLKDAGVPLPRGAIVE